MWSQSRRAGRFQVVTRLRASLVVVAGLLVACGESRSIAVDSGPPLEAAAEARPPSSPPPAPAPAPPTLPTVQSACPDGMAELGAYCIDRYEAHLVARGPGAATSLHPYFERPAPGVTYEARSAPGVYPQAYINRIEAAAACSAAGKRLCSMTEWRRACQGDRGRTYPYGDDLVPKRCNSEKQHLLTLRFGYDPRHWRYEDFNDPTLDQEPGFLARTGAYAECVSDEGVHDLVGNLHEWVSDTLDGALQARLDAEASLRSYQPSSPGNGVFMGGFFSTRRENGPGCKFTTFAHEPGYHDYSTGFRCCADGAR
jgi:sulfatase modifying factor 1